MNKSYHITKFNITPAQLIVMTDMSQNKTTGKYIAPTWGALVRKGLVELVRTMKTTRLSLTAKGAEAVGDAHSELKDILLDIPAMFQNVGGKPALIPDQEDWRAFAHLAHIGYLKTNNGLVYYTTEKFDEVTKSPGFANRQYIL